MKLFVNQKQYTVDSRCQEQLANIFGIQGSWKCCQPRLVWRDMGRQQKGRRKPAVNIVVNNQQSTILPTERGLSSVRLQIFPRGSLAVVISCISAWEVLVFMERTNCHKQLMMYHSSAVAAYHFCKNIMQTPDQLAMHLMNHLRKDCSRKSFDVSLFPS